MGSKIRRTVWQLVELKVTRTAHAYGKRASAPTTVIRVVISLLLGKKGFWTAKQLGDTAYSWNVIDITGNFNVSNLTL